MSRNVGIEATFHAFCHMPVPDEINRTEVLKIQHKIWQKKSLMALRQRQENLRFASGLSKYHARQVSRETKQSETARDLLVIIPCCVTGTAKVLLSISVCI